MADAIPTLSSVAPALAQLGAGLLDSLEEITETLVEAILAEDPSYTASGTPTRDDLRRSCHDNLQRILENLADRPASGQDPFAAPRETGHRRAEQSVPLESVLHAYRLGHRVIWEHLVLEARRAGGTTLDVLVDAASEVWALVDTYSSQVATAYRTTELEMARHDDRRRDALVDALLEGRGTEWSVTADAAIALGLPEHGRLCVVVVAGTEHARLASDALAVRGMPSAWRTKADREVGIVDLGQTPTAEVVALLTRLGVTSAGLSPEVDDLAQVDVAARQAAIAMRSQALGVVRLDDVLPGAMLATAPDLAARLVERTLSRVLALPSHESSLLIDTLQAWLDCNGSAGQTAVRLYCHRNTVLNRLRRIESLSGRSLEDFDTLVEWRLALWARNLDPDASFS
ncbi:MAG: helix-turn-helix domain-containing protein [Mycobacteriales bacterium]